MSVQMQKYFDFRTFFPSIRMWVLLQWFITVYGLVTVFNRDRMSSINLKAQVKSLNRLCGLFRTALSRVF